MAKRKIYLDEISVDYGDVNSNPYFNQQNYAKVEEPKKKVNNRKEYNDFINNLRGNRRKQELMSLIKR